MLEIIFWAQSMKEMRVWGLMLEIIFWAQSMKEMESLGSNA
jgi:hypothetical protein